MKFETLKSFDKKKLIIPIVIICFLIIVITIFISHSKYIYKDSITIIEGTKIDSNIIGIYQQKDGCEGDNCYQEVDIMPSEGYEINTDKTYCYIDDETKPIKNKIYTNNKGETVISGLNKKSKCFLYFDEVKTASEKSYEQLVKLNPELKSKGNNAHFESISCGAERACYDDYAEGEVIEMCEDCYQENGIYEAPDDDGTSYYFRGTVENNYVKYGKTNSERWFAYGYDNETYDYMYKHYSSQQECENDINFDSYEPCTKLYGKNEDIWWRIIRINGDGSIRMIYAGTGTGDTAPTQTSVGSIIGYNKFNNSYERAEYVGFEYVTGIRNGTTKNESGEQSTILKELEKWFEINLKDEFEEGYLDTNAGFCGDRTAYSDYSGNTLANKTHGIGTEETYYGAYIRNYPGRNVPSPSNPAKPTFKCLDKDNDLYTYKNAQQGTQTLKYPVGLITADEVTFAGGLDSVSNSKYYLYNNSFYWAMSPYYSGEYAYVSSVLIRGGLNWSDVSTYRGVRPVVNLKSGILKYGNGTSTNPFRTTSN